MFDIIVVGFGKLAKSILANLKLFDLNNQIRSVKAYSDIDNFIAKSIFVHVGSGREYDKSLKSAINSNSTYIQAATKNDFDMNLPEILNIRYINAPNLAIDLIKFFYLIKQIAPMYNNHLISVIESHQSSKVSEPGTAYKICDLLDQPYSCVTSVRDPNKQIKLGIKNIDLHAYHKIVISKGDTELCFETKIEGHKPYVEGLYTIISILNHIEIGYTDIHTLMEDSLLV